VTITTLPTAVTEYCDILWTDDLVNFQPVGNKSLFHSVQSYCSSMSRILLRCHRDGGFYCSKQIAAFLKKRSCDQLSDISHFALATNQGDAEMSSGTWRPSTLWSVVFLCLSWLPCTNHRPVRAINFPSLCSALSISPPRYICQFLRTPRPAVPSGTLPCSSNLGLLVHHDGRIIV
jgi:hypothetical protein